MTSITPLYEQFNTFATLIILFLAPILAGALAGAGGGGLATTALLLISVRWFVSWRQRQVISLSPVVIALWILAALQALSLFRSINRDLTLKAIGFTVAAAAFAQLTSSVMAAYNEPPVSNINPRLVVAAAMTASLLWESVTGLQEYLINVRSDPSSRVFATFFNPDTTAGFFAMALPICLSCLWLDLPAVPMFLVALASFMGFITLTLTASKGGALALAIGLSVTLVLQRKLWKGSDSVVRWRVVAVYSTSILGALASSHALLSRIATAGTVQANSALFRKMVWRSAFRMMMNRPLTGFGAGTFGQAYGRFAVAGPTQMAHNGYLQAGAECGVAALLVMLLAVSLPILRGVREGWSWDAGGNGALRFNWIAHILGAGITGGLVASAVHNLIDFDWSIPGLWLLFWGLAGAVGGLGKKSGEDGLESSRQAGALRGLPLLLLAGLHLLAAGAMGLGAAAAYYGQAARESLGQAIPAPPEVDPEKAIVLASTAIGLNPLDGSLRLIRGQAEIQAARSTSDGPEGRDRLERAQADLETAARLMPASAAPLYPLGALWKQRGNLPAAAEIYRQAIERDPHAMGAALDLADIETLLRHPDAARQALERVARVEDTPFARVRGVPEAFDSHYPLAWAGLAHLDAEAGQWSLSATEAERALKDMDEYAHLAGQFIRLEAVMTMYAPQGRSEMKELEGQAYAILKDNLKHLEQMSRLPEVEARHRRFTATLESLKDPS